MADRSREPAGPWQPERARAWQAQRGWRVGCNFVPSSASNPLEMWQAETFDLPTLERELDFAAELGFTSLRVFLHDLAWQQDPAGFLERIETFLVAADRRGIGTLPVLFDGVWNPYPKPGAQPEPRLRVHNAGWVQSPGAEVLSDPARQDALEPYVKGVIARFRDDPRIDGWDLFNEPDSPNLAYLAQEIEDKAARALELLGKSFAWAREVDPRQPLTVGVWDGDWDDAAGLTDLQRLSLDQSDVISFHCYGDLDALNRRVSSLRRYERPILCTEFMARSLGSTFDPHLGWMKAQGVGAYCWGLVAGRTQTEYSWDSWVKTYESEPSPWFHDVLRRDGTPYDPAEVAYIRSVTG
ncbi:MAG: cellulase family glycosylhydrolase [Deltaproteobacteria bacterium]|nr:MAG: cellulase family glycosylhydrolase [Deltaproteobacteria bacterium]